MVGAYVEFFGNRNFLRFRDAARGWRKDFLRGTICYLRPANEMVNFSDYETVEKMYYQLNNAGENSQNELAKKVIEIYKNWKIDGKNIEEIIKECTFVPPGPKKIIGVLE